MKFFVCMLVDSGLVLFNERNNGVLCQKKKKKSWVFDELEHEAFEIIS